MSSSSFCHIIFYLKSYRSWHTILHFLLQAKTELELGSGIYWSLKYSGKPKAFVSLAFGFWLLPPMFIKNVLTKNIFLWTIQRYDSISTTILILKDDKKKHLQPHDKILRILPPNLLHDCLTDKSRHFWTSYQPLCGNIVCEKKLR